MNAIPGLTYVRYEEHPAFSGIPFDDDPETAALAAALNEVLENIRQRAKLPSTDVSFLLNSRVPPVLDPLFARLAERNADLDCAADFFGRLKAKIVELIFDDFAVYADRGIHSYLDHSEAADTVAAALFQQGYWLGNFAADAVSLLEEAVADAKKTLWQRHEEENLIDRERLSINQWGAEQVTRFSAVFNNEIILAALTNYMGWPQRFGGCAFELSVGGTKWWKGRYGRADESRLAAYYHNDESLSFPKLICYLSEVGPSNGPTSLIKRDLGRSMLSWISGRALDIEREVTGRRGVCSMDTEITGTELGRRVFARLPREMRSLGHFGNDILAGSAEETFLVDNRELMIGGAGRFVLFDGARVFHRGGIVEEGHRWVFQVVYSRQPS